MLYTCIQTKVTLMVQLNMHTSLGRMLSAQMTYRYTLVIHKRMHTFISKTARKYRTHALEITPPSIISPPYFLLKYAAEVYLSLI